MHVYLYRADLYCDECGGWLRTNTPMPPAADLENEYTWDSDRWPKGPYPDGGGEADSPHHCAAGEDCRQAIVLDGRKVGVPLENPLTEEGIRYTRNAIAEGGPCAELWRQLYPEAAPVRPNVPDADAADYAVYQQGRREGRRAAFTELAERLRKTAVVYRTCPPDVIDGDGCERARIYEELAAEIERRWLRPV